MWGIMVEILQIVFDPFIISAIIYGFAIIAGCTNLYKWRGLRIGLFGLIYMALSSWASSISFLSSDGVLFVFLVLHVETAFTPKNTLMFASVLATPNGQCFLNLNL